MVEDAKENSVIVYYRDRRGKSRRRLYPLTGTGRKEAKAFAEGWIEQRKAATKDEAPPVVTTHQLWELYSRYEIKGLREATQVSYTQHWGVGKPSWARTGPSIL